MKVLDIKKMIPDIYCQESRDFQILCNLYGCIVNGMRFDSYSLYKTIDSETCKAEFLRLLSTKLGFFPDKFITNEQLRYALAGFKDLMHNKGSLSAVAGAIHVFLKTLGIHNKLKLSLTKETIVYAGRVIKDHTIIVALESPVQDTTLLDEIFKHIIPAGFEYIITFYVQIDPYDEFVFHEQVTLIYTSDTINANVSYRTDSSKLLADKTITDSDEMRLMGDIDTTEVIAKDIDYSTYNTTLTTQYRGLVTSLSSIASPQTNDIVGLMSGEAYYVHNGTSFVQKMYSGSYRSLTVIPLPINDTVIRSDGSDSYFLRVTDNWAPLRYLGKVPNLADCPYTTLQQYDLIVTSKITAYKYNGTAWAVYNNPINVLTKEQHTT